MLKRRQIRAIKRAFRKLFKRTWNFVTTVSKTVVDWFLRTVLLMGVRKQQQAHSKAGFVLPTIVMLLLVVTLVVATLLLRTQNRTSQVIGAREEQVIYNAATPAIERAKAKLEYLFQQDTRLPFAPASDQLLLQMLVNETQIYPGLTTPLLVNGRDPYTFEGEQRIDLNGDGNPNNDPAWSYQADVDNDGKQETVVYGLYLRSRSDDRTISIDGVGGRDGNGRPIDPNPNNDTDKNKARVLVTRNGPINTINLNDPTCAAITVPGTVPPAGQILPVDESVWYPAGSGILRKTFQVDAIVVSSKQGTSRTVATLEFQQDRQLDRANRWGAWFRYDMELYPGVAFNWNGAMYSAGNIFVGSSDLFRAFLISSQKSCFYGKDSSEIVVMEEPETNGVKGFQGQIVARRLFQSGTAGAAKFDLQKEGGNNTEPDLDANRTTLNDGKDSTNKDATNLSLKPDVLFTEDLSRARGGSDRNLDARVASWESTAFIKQGKMRNNLQNPPYVDDTYRADNRYGPKPKYDRVDRRYWLRSPDNPGGPQNGDPIPAGETKLINNTTDTTSDPEFRNLGLDGYWERRAWANGLRIVVSPRLELGNAFGWVNRDLNANGNRNDSGEIDPLYPVSADTNNPVPISHEKQQRRTLRDNLAAVQSTVVYQANSGLGTPAGDTPIACVATTAHPGSLQKDLDSRNFQQSGQRYWYPGQPNPSPLVSDFFYGYGTNGWEYTTPTLANFGGGPLRTALQNLANFAGDYNDPNNSGAYPPTQGGRVYPNPYLTMWGNFSNLKRALTLPANNSIADNSYVHTAGCTLGMLANNINYFQTPGYSNTWQPDLTNLATELKRVIGTTTSPFPTGFTPEANDFITAIEKPPVGVAPVAANTLSLARFVHTKEQIARDRRYGFADTPTTGGFTYTITKQLDGSGNPSTGFQYAGKTYSNNTGQNTVTLGCDPTSPANNYFGLGSPTTWTAAQEENFVILATSLCSTKPKFPSLYYLFPVANHDRVTAPTGATQPANEPYLAPPAPHNGGYPGPEQFTQISDPDLTAIANMVQPKGENWTSGNNSPNGNWYLPTEAQANPIPPLENDFQITTRNGGTRYTSLIDSAFFDSREMMTVRALTLDLNLLRRGQIGTDTWLPASGIIYAFREDAVREDAIMRPAGGVVSDNRNPGSPRDPQYPVATNNRISTKPVDFYADPDRRSYGFRLRNGQDLRRAPNGALNNQNPRGMTFISDNPVYIQGDLNYHSTDGTVNNLEEFRTPLQQPNWSNFYTREDLDDRFARNGDGKDTWRPTEILSDAITILSNNFRKGYIDLGITNDTTNPVTPAGRYSFRAMNGPTGAPPNGWVLEDGTLRTIAPVPPATQANNQKPIKVSHNGNPMFCNIAASTPSGICPPSEWREYTAGYRPFISDYRDAINPAINTRVNSIIVSGIIPSRAGQGNGGFHNFPRFIENWSGGVQSIISGSFVQLNFSTYSTAPFNQSAWEPGSGANADAPNWFFQPPTRIWGYDVGLQYAPAGPLAQRFVTSGRKRSEFYRDLQVDDPYICRLRLALNRTNSTLDPASRRECD